jgi:hypothetical protein
MIRRGLVKGRKILGKAFLELASKIPQRGSLRSIKWGSGYGAGFIFENSSSAATKKSFHLDKTFWSLGTANQNLGEAKF